GLDAVGGLGEALSVEAQLGAALAVAFAAIAGHLARPVAVDVGADAIDALAAATGFSVRGARLVVLDAGAFAAVSVGAVAVAAVQVAGAGKARREALTAAANAHHRGRARRASVAAVAQAGRCRRAEPRAAIGALLAGGAGRAAFDWWGATRVALGAA